LSSERLRNFVTEHRILFVVIAVGMVLSFTSRHFLNVKNIVSILTNMTVEGSMVIGMALVIFLGEIDLSVGSVMALATTLSVLFQNYGVVIGVFVGLFGGLIAGLVNGVLITKLKLPSIAVTLGTMILINGVVFALTGEHTIAGSNSSFLFISQTQIFDIPLPIVIFVVLVGVFEVIMQKSFFGRNVFAVGGNATASRLFGIKVERVRISCFALSGFLSGVAGVLLAGKINTASGNLGGSGTLILVITAVLLGGISLRGGEGSITRAIEGILLLMILNNGMVLMRISPFVQDVIRGSLLILVLSIEAVNVRRKKYL
jgi:ribose/xylose/arabinose/galactoside ABC-type transport system permease subunit